MEHDFDRERHVVVTDAADADVARGDHLDGAGTGVHFLDVFDLPAAAQLHEVNFFPLDADAGGIHFVVRLAAVDDVGVGVARVGNGRAEEGGVIARIVAVRRYIDRNDYLDRNDFVACRSAGALNRRRGWLNALAVGARAVQVVAGDLLRFVAQEDVLTGVAGVQADLAG
ncbi:MAG: hypothetical protein IH863_07070 [Chloroflexi bacterium]|nr:hypothetical protein [Chloroflexota bacterium]